jgi:hypothetical protein
MPSVPGQPQLAQAGGLERFGFAEPVARRQPLLILSLSAAQKLVRLAAGALRVIGSAHGGSPFRRGGGTSSVSLALHALSQGFAGPAYCLGFFARASLRGLFKVAPPLHLAERSLALHLFLEHAERGVDVVVAYEHLQIICS